MKRLLALLCLLVALAAPSMAAMFSGGPGSAPDGLTLTRLPTIGHPENFSDVSARTLVTPVFGTGRSLFVNVYGQSNSCSTNNATIYSPTNPTKIRNLNIGNGGTYAAQDPILGGCAPSTANSGSWAIQVADKLITDGYLDLVVIQMFGIGSSSISEWTPGGALNHRITVAKNRYAALNQTPTRCMTWRDQGENDNFFGTSNSAYASMLAGEIATVAPTVNCPLFIAQATYFNGTVSNGIRAAQLAAVNNTTVFFLGDQDVIGPAGRLGDNTDLSGSGVAQAASIFTPKIEAYLNTH